MKQHISAAVVTVFVKHTVGKLQAPSPYGSETDPFLCTS
jgi:hypothetical protein